MSVVKLIAGPVSSRAHGTFYRISAQCAPYDSRWCVREDGVPCAFHKESDLRGECGTHECSGYEFPTREQLGMRSIWVDEVKYLELKLLGQT